MDGFLLGSLMLFVSCLGAFIGLLIFNFCQKLKIQDNKRQINGKPSIKPKQNWIAERDKQLAKIPIARIRHD